MQEEPYRRRLVHICKHCLDHKVGYGMQREAGKVAFHAVGADALCEVLRCKFQDYLKARRGSYAICWSQANAHMRESKDYVQMHKTIRIATFSLQAMS